MPPHAPPQLHRLANGLVVLAEPDPDARSAAAGWFVRAGARDALPDGARAGHAHFLEHVAFRGPAERDGEATNEAFDAVGARYDAYTAAEWTAYHGAVQAAAFPAFLTLLTDLLRPALRPADVEAERRIILEEIGTVHDDPAERGPDLATPRFWRGHPLGRSILGAADDLAALTAAELRAFHARYYAPDRLVLVLTGAFDLHATLSWIEGTAAEWVPSGAARFASPAAPATGVEAEVDADLAWSYATLLAPGVPAADADAAELLAGVLGEPEAGVLHWAVVEPGLADAAGLAHDGGEDAGAFTGWLTAPPERFERALVGAREALTAAQAAPLDAAAWGRAVRALGTELALRAEAPLGRMHALAEDWLERGVCRSPEARIEALGAVPAEAGDRLLAARPFDRLFASCLVPRPLSSSSSGRG